MAPVPDPPLSAMFVSDHTGITAEMLGTSLLARFDSAHLRRSTRSFIDDPAKADALVAELEAQRPPPLVFTTIADPAVLASFRGGAFLHIDLFEPFLGRLERALDQRASQRVGAHHTIHDRAGYQARIDAVEFALATDDGVNVRRYGDADLIVVGVSRVGKTPTCLYLALQYGVRAANYPFTPEDIEHTLGGDLPASLRPNRDRLYGLVIDPIRLHQLRRERRPDSDYASLERCEREVAWSERLFARFGIPFQSTTTTSVEEIAARVLQDAGLARRR